jgi:hypothetical protein
VERQKATPKPFHEWVIHKGMLSSVFVGNFSGKQNDASASLGRLFA